MIENILALNTPRAQKSLFLIHWEFNSNKEPSANTEIFWGGASYLGFFLALFGASILFPSAESQMLFLQEPRLPLFLIPSLFLSNVDKIITIIITINCDHMYQIKE